MYVQLDVCLDLQRFTFLWMYGSWCSDPVPSDTHTHENLSLPIFDYHDISPSLLYYFNTVATRPFDTSVCKVLLLIINNDHREK